jgi:hypothetical protein
MARHSACHRPRRRWDRRSALATPKSIDRAGRGWGPIRRCSRRSVPWPRKRPVSCRRPWVAPRRRTDRRCGMRSALALDTAVTLAPRTEHAAAATKVQWCLRHQSRARAQAEAVPNSGGTGRDESQFVGRSTRRPKAPPRPHRRAAFHGRTRLEHGPWPPDEAGAVPGEARCFSRPPGAARGGARVAMGGKRRVRRVTPPRCDPGFPLLRSWDRKARWTTESSTDICWINMWTPSSLSLHPACSFDLRRLSGSRLPSGRGFQNGHVGAILRSIKVSLFGDEVFLAQVARRCGAKSRAAAVLPGFSKSEGGERGQDVYANGCDTQLDDRIRVEQCFRRHVARWASAEEFAESDEHASRVCLRWSDKNIEILGGSRASMQGECMRPTDQVPNACVVERFEQLFEVSGHVYFARAARSRGSRLRQLLVLRGIDFRTRREHLPRLRAVQEPARHSSGALARRVSTAV